MSTCSTQCSIDADYHGEERYSKLSLAFQSESERQQIEACIKDVTAGQELQPNIYTTTVSNGKTVIVIEYHDDYDREAGKIFTTILQKLGIDKCC